MLTCILKHLNSNKVLRAKICTQNVLNRQILADSNARISELNLRALLKFCITQCFCCVFTKFLTSTTPHIQLKYLYTNSEQKSHKSVPYIPGGAKKSCPL